MRKKGVCFYGEILAEFFIEEEFCEVQETDVGNPYFRFVAVNEDSVFNVGIVASEEYECAVPAVVSPFVPNSI